MIDDVIDEYDTPREPIIVTGFGYDENEETHFLVILNRALNDNELRAFHEYVRKFKGLGLNS